MPTAPSPPKSLPQYLAEGVPKQDDTNLEALQEWIDELLAYRRDVAETEIEGTDEEAIQAVENTEEGTVVIKKVTCGKDSCKCQGGELHGPYKYLVRRRGEDLEWDYQGAVDT